MLSIHSAAVLFAVLLHLARRRAVVARRAADSFSKRDDGRGLSAPGGASSGEPPRLAVLAHGAHYYVMRRGSRALLLALLAASAIQACSSVGGEGLVDGVALADAGSGAAASGDGDSQAEVGLPDASPPPPACELLTGTPEILATGEIDPSSVVADAVHVYWLRKSGGGVRRTALIPPRAIEDFDVDAQNPAALVLTEHFAVWHSYGADGGLAAKDKQQSAAQATGYGYGGAALVALSGDEVAYAQLGGVFKRVLSSGVESRIAREGKVSATAYAAPYLSFTAPAPLSRGIFTCGPGSCGALPAVLLADGEDESGIAMAADATHAYWVVSSCCQQPSVGGVRRVAKSGGSAEDVITGLIGPNGATSAIAVDGTHVYVAMSGGGLARARKGTTNCKLTPGTNLVTSMSLSGEWVYFTDATTVGRIHK